MKNIIVTNCKGQPITGRIAGTSSFPVTLFYVFFAIVKLSVAFSLLILAGCSPVKETPIGRETNTSALKLNNRTVSPGMPGLHNSIYVENEGTRLLSESRFSEDNGLTWSEYSYKPDFHSGLPYGYRRDRITSVRDHLTGRIITIVNSLDTPGLDPAQTTLAGPGGELLNPGGGFTYTDVIILIGTWTDGNKLSWKTSQRVEADPKRSTRGMIEPTLLELEDGRILMVMRGSNGGKFDPQNLLPSYKWYAVSEDGGETWSKPEPWCFEDGEPFFSPSSMSSIFKHSSGRCFWVGNMTKVNCQNNLPRWPLVIAEVNTDNLKLIRSSLLTVDTQREEDLSKGRLDISHMALIEDRETKEILLTYPRNTNTYKTSEWITVRFSVRKIKK